MSGIEEEIKALVNARYPLVYIVSFEERRVEEHLATIGKTLGKRVWVWTISQGFVDLATRRAQENSADPNLALDHLLKTPPQGAYLYVFKDFHVFLDQMGPTRTEHAVIVRKLRDAVYRMTGTASSLFILSPTIRIPIELEKDTVIVDYPLPSKKDFERLIDQFSTAYSGQATISLDSKHRETVADALLGLTLTEAENVLSRALINDRRLDPRDIPLIIREKEQIIKKSGVLEFYSLREALEDVGGLDALKKWLMQKRKSFADEARQYKVDSPKGVLLIGVPGCGKSLTAKAVANGWKMPLLRFDLGKVFGQYVGQSEDNIRRAIMTAESVAPCVLWIDEIEKGFAGVGASDLDSGVTARVFGTFITWLNEKTKPVFVVATANNISRLPPELMRKGRFDEIFFVDLPNAHEREEIFAVHLRRRDLDPSRFDLKQLSDLAEGFSGADIETVVAAAVEAAYSQPDSRWATTEDIIRAIRATMPLSVTLKEQIEAMRGWARTRARPASTPWEEVPVPVEEEFVRRRKLEF